MDGQATGGGSTSHIKWDSDDVLISYCFALEQTDNSNSLCLCIIFVTIVVAWRKDVFILFVYILMSLKSNTREERRNAILKNSRKKNFGGKKTENVVFYRSWIGKTTCRTVVVKHKNAHSPGGARCRARRRIS